MNNKKYCVYICEGCGIRESLDLKALCDIPKEEGLSVKKHSFLCGKKGISFIKDDIINEGINSLIICACSKRVNFDIFRFDNCVIERVNLREGVVWSHPRDEFKFLSEEEKKDPEKFDVVQMMAEDYIRMGIARVEKVSLPEPYFLDKISKKILIIGGGITGISASLDIAKMGYEVVLIEKSSNLGGYVANLRKQLPMSEPYDGLISPIIESKIKEIESYSNIEIRLNTIVARIAGQPGEFNITLKKPEEKIPFDVPYPLPDEMKVDEKGKELDNDILIQKYKEYNIGKEDVLTMDPNGELFGSIILAAGWRPEKLNEKSYSHLGFGKFSDVVTNHQFEEIANKGKILRPSDGKEAKSVVFIQNPNNSDDSDFPYTGAVTSMVSLKQAKYVRDDYRNDGKAYIIYEHMRTPGFSELFYKNIQNNPGIFMTKGSITEVKFDGSNLFVEAKNTLLGEKLSIKADMVVLATGMIPVTKYESVINLAYRQGPAFRDIGLFNGYVDSNFICFPYETQRTGIYAAGSIRRSMSIEESIEDASGAALKAVQCIESVNRGVSVHPRSGDMTYPDFFFQRCTQCKRCTEECPFGALDDDEKGTPKPNPSRCRRCGTCMGACPERIIGFSDYNIDSIGSQVKSIVVPSEDDYDEPPFRILGLVCENDAYPALDMLALNKLSYSANVRLIPVRCLGSVNVIWIKDALSQGMDGVFLLGCKHGDNYQCHFVKGSELADIRITKIGEALKSLALEKERVAQFEVAIDDFDKLPEMINNFVSSIEDLGPNPFKGF
jgi:quinone-modifying oxidoreductase subunit QmoB